MTEHRITVKGDTALLVMRLLSLLEERGECVLHIDSRRPGLRWRELQPGLWEKAHAPAEPIDAAVR